MSVLPMRFLLIDTGGDPLSVMSKVSIVEFTAPTDDNGAPFPSAEAIEEAAGHLKPETPRDERTLFIVPLHEARSVNLRRRGAYEVTSTGSLP